MRILGVPILSPAAATERIVSDLQAMARMARAAPAQLDRVLELGEEIARTGQAVLEVAERLERRAEVFTVLAERLDARAGELLSLGAELRQLGFQVDARGGQIVDSAGQVVEAGAELVAVLPTVERAIALATPLEGAIDRFGRLVDRFPGGAQQRRQEPVQPGEQPS
jgi:hypothetical protein